ncbi:hypothetical protein [Actinomadura sp. DC4]|uniref:hypothetical protein n=1 Tax=Actinomadura sp. DC4 TaxID=3055069 RepID=UPI0025B2394C|nr:hypothetical protein [Actinomadura sp. DC4]MDN3354924.1 hypothetical protein [Actinomadura sp. DC4]
MARGPGDFGKAFTALLRAAGTNPDGVRRALPGLVARSVLYDWKNGEHLPNETGPLVRVVELCLERAGDDLGDAPGDVDGWLELLAEAKQTRDGEAERPVARTIEQWGPLRLGVHQVVRGGPLPAYTRRAHDHLLYAVLDPQVAANRLVVLRGGSSTGKSRAAYEAVRARLPRVPVFYPPTAAALDALLGEGIPARSVLWLNELRHYADDSGGQAVLAKLAGLLPGRDRQVVITSVWPEYWAAYTVDPDSGPGAPDPARASRALLTALPELTGIDVDPALGGVVDVPEAFTYDDLGRARRHGDPLLHEAMAAAERAGSPGQVAQYLAGVPALLAQYDGPGADPYGHALITAAMDAVRLGHDHPLGRELLQDAAVGYLADRDRALPAEAWRRAMERAWDHATRVLRGAVRALEPVPPERGIGVAGYRLTDYLDQYGRTHRKERIPPPSFWAAIADHGHPDDVGELGGAAWRYGLYRDAARLDRKATAHGDLWAAGSLVEHLRELRPADRRPALWAAAHAAAEHPSAWPVAMARLLEQLRKAGEHEHAAAFAARAAFLPFDHVSLGLDGLLKQLWEIGGRDHITTLLDRVARHDVSALTLLMQYGTGTREQVGVVAERAAIRLPLDDPRAVARLLGDLELAGRREEIGLLLDRGPAAHVALDDPDAVATLLYELARIRANDQVAALLDRDPAARVALDDPKAVVRLLNELRRAGAHEQVGALLDRDPAAHAGIGDLAAVADLLATLRQAGADDQVTALLRRDPAARIAHDAPPADAFGVTMLLFELGSAEAHEQLTALLDRDPAAHVSLDKPYDVAGLLFALREVKAPAGLSAALEAQLSALARRAGAHVRLRDGRDLSELLHELDLLGRMGVPGAGEQVPVLLDRIASADAGTVAHLLEVLRGRGTLEERLMAALLDRDLAAHVTFSDPRAVARLLAELETAGAGDQFSALAGRAAARIPLDSPRPVIGLLRLLWSGGANDQADVLAGRAAASLPLTDSGAVAELLDCLGAAATVLLDRDPAAHVDLDDRFDDDPDDRPYPVSDGVRRLLRRLAKAGANDQVAALLERLPAAGRFYDFVEVVEDPERFRFGRERDGTPAAPWGWDDLD